jgi:predicted aldo/keto reductase-like oxidoreductase
MKTIYNLFGLGFCSLLLILSCQKNSNSNYLDSLLEDSISLDHRHFDTIARDSMQAGAAGYFQAILAKKRADSVAAVRKKEAAERAAEAKEQEKELERKAEELIKKEGL